MTSWVFQRQFLSKPAETQEITPIIVEPLDTPASSSSRVRDAIHPIQFGIFPKRLAQSLDRTEEAQHLQLEPRTPTRRTGGAIEKHIVEKCTASRCRKQLNLDHEFLKNEYSTNQFHVTYYGGCPVGHQGYLCALQRYQRRVTTCRERRTFMVCSTSCHHHVHRSDGCHAIAHLSLL